MLLPLLGNSARWFPAGSRVLAEGAQHSKKWGVPIEELRRLYWLSINDVIHVAESPSRLPAEMANQIYRHGETVMGYTIFTVVFGDQSKQAYVAGNAVDFIQYLTGKTPRDVVGVIPRAGREQFPLRTPRHTWSLFSD
jgi:hypothetical protein